MGFLDSYKRLEKLCREVMGEERAISAYIDAMQNLPNGAFYVSGWNADLKTLKHYRWIRNRIVHDPNCTEQNLCQPCDGQWLEQFHARILRQTDPLALYRKATCPNPPKKPAMSHQSPQEKQQKTLSGWFALWVFLLAAVAGGILAYIWNSF